MSFRTIPVVISILAFCQGSQVPFGVVHSECWGWIDTFELAPGRFACAAGCIDPGIDTLDFTAPASSASDAGPHNVLDRPEVCRSATSRFGSIAILPFTTGIWSRVIILRGKNLGVISAGPFGFYHSQYCIFPGDSLSNVLDITTYVKRKENARGKGPREKKNGIGGVWGKLKESGHRTGRNTSREGTGNVTTGEIRSGWKLKKGKEKREILKRKKNQEKAKKSREKVRAAEIAEGQKHARTRFSWRWSPPVSGCRCSSLFHMSPGVFRTDCHVLAHM